jgi:precorrin-2/cobalt-factor-2 C20-methyltransferase
LLYSTYIYMLQALRNRISELNVVTIPGITAFSAAAAIAGFPVGKAKEPVTIAPTADDLDAVRQALSAAGKVILMKIGKRLDRILDILEETGGIEHGVFVSHAGMESERVETNLRNLRGERPEKVTSQSSLFMPNRRRLHESLLCGSRSRRSGASND